MLIDKFKEILESSKKENTCYPICKRPDSTCSGRYGGDSFSDYVAYECIDCKYFEYRLCDIKSLHT